MRTWKLFTAGALFASVLTLSACSAKNSDAAKKAFVSDVIALNDTKVYNGQNVNLKIDSFKASGEGATSPSKALEGATFDISTGIDKDKKIMAYAATANIDSKAYKLDALLSENGMYINSSDIKALYNSNKKNISKSDNQVALIYGSMVDSLTKPYFVMDAATFDSMAASTGETWASTVDKAFAQSTALKKSDLEKVLKDAPNTDFTKSGDKITAKISGQGGSLADVLKNYSSFANLSKNQLDLFKKATKDIKIDHLSVKIVIDEKAHTMDSDFSGKVQDSQNNSGLAFKMSMDASRSKLKAALTEPASTETETLADLQKAVMSKLQSQSGLAY
ncbi:hypothetical protein [Lactococcus kimchii]|uniref:hypothetical protein n=1 Tax=Lactococcus sp. S-13 TaxID=2507158 RepID=UPI001023BF8C|nr:hypothetical protein [Lactococcus sp. S-13]RZI49292.1 hypothetical protein EQJ87_07455 [Lactococcus sp. S-13]